jgi:hypothetical protein
VAYYADVLAIGHTNIFWPVKISLAAESAFCFQIVEYYVHAMKVGNAGVYT